MIISATRSCTEARQMSRTMHFALFCYDLPLACGWHGPDSHPRLMRGYSDTSGLSGTL